MTNPAYLSPDEMAERILELEGELAEVRESRDDSYCRCNDCSWGCIDTCLYCKKRHDGVLRAQLTAAQDKIARAVLVGVTDLTIGFNYDAETVEKMVAILKGGNDD